MYITFVGNPSRATENQESVYSTSSEENTMTSAPMDVDSDKDEPFDGAQSDGSDCSDDFDGSLSDGSDGIGDVLSGNDWREQPQSSLTNDLRKWCLKYNIKNQATSALLKVLRKHCGDAAFNLASDARTLLKSSNDPVRIDEIAGGQYWHNGLGKCLQMYFR